MKTYKDGISHERCTACLRVLRDPSGAEYTDIKVADLEWGMKALRASLMNLPNAQAAAVSLFITKLEQAVGRTVDQLKEAQ